MSAHRRPSRRGTVLLGIVAAVAAAGPLATLALEALADRWFGTAIVPQAFGWRGVRRAFDDPATVAAIGNSLLVACAALGVAFVLAWPAARALATDGRRSLRLMLLVPLLVPPLAIGEGLSPWFLRFGIADSLAAIVLAHLVTVLPYVTLALVPAFTPQLAALEQTAATLGAGSPRRLLTVTFPAARRHVALALALGFTVSWSQYGTSLVIGGGIPMLPVVLVPFVSSDRQIAAVLDLLFLAPPLLLVGLAAIVRQPGEASTPRAAARRDRRPTTVDTAMSTTSATAADTNAGLVGS